MYHEIEVVGFLGKEPEMRYLPSGTPVTNFNVATDHSYTKEDGTKVKETTWFRISAFGKMGENCNEYLHKGSAVLVKGRLNSDAKTGGPKVWQGKDGAGASYEVIANMVKFLPSPKATRGEPDEVEQGTTSDEDIPF